MSDAVWFGVIFVAFFILRIIAATAFFLLILPSGIKCPHCDAPTIRVQSRGWNTLMPWFRTSWCYECGWDGLLKGAVSAPPPVVPGPPSAQQTSAPVKGRRR